MFQQAHELGMFTVLWCYLRNTAFKTKEADYHVAADLTGQANHLGVTIEADIIKQKLPENNGGYNALKFGKTHKKVYSELTSDHPIDLTRYQVANCYMGRAGLINSGGASAGESDLTEAVKTAVINKRAGGMGLISGRKAFQRPMNEGVGLLNAIQDVYLEPASRSRSRLPTRAVGHSASGNRTPRLPTPPPRRHHLVDRQRALGFLDLTRASPSSPDARGVNSWQQSWSGMIEIGNVPSRCASATISSLSIPTSGLSTSIVVAPAMVVRFSSVCEATWPMTSPVTSARARQRRASRSAMRSIRRR